jgi:hypothetical protein
MRHHPLGHHRADPLDHPRTQVAADALDGGRQHGGIGVHLELRAVLRVAAPAPGQAQAFPDLGAQQRPHHCQQIRAGPLGGHPGDGVAGVLVGVGDPLQHRLQHRLAVRRRGLTGHSDHSAGHPQPLCTAPGGPDLARPSRARPAALRAGERPTNVPAAWHRHHPHHPGRVPARLERHRHRAQASPSDGTGRSAPLSGFTASGSSRWRPVDAIMGGAQSHRTFRIPRP